MEEEKPKRGRPRKEVVSETAIVPVEDDDEAWVPVPKRTRKKKEPVQELAPEPIPEPEVVQQPPEAPKPKRVRKKPDPATAVASDVSFQSKRGAVSFSAMRAPPKPKLERDAGYQRPYASLHDRYGGYNPYDSFAIA